MYVLFHEDEKEEDKKRVRVENLDEYSPTAQENIEASVINTPDNNQTNVITSSDDSLARRFEDFLTYSAVASPANADGPTTVNETIMRQDGHMRKSAILSEIESLDENNTWELTELPDDRKSVQSKWIFKTKKDADGKVVKYKARLVAKALAVKNGLQIHQMDAVTAFLQGDLDEDLEQPERFNDGTDRVCKLNRSIYELKQSGR
ncbi:hypothetical protein Trydic_g10105, partial [Trypoxylus dichotomus]